MRSSDLKNTLKKMVDILKFNISVLNKCYRLNEFVLTFYLIIISENLK